MTTGPSTTVAREQRADLLVDLKLVRERLAKASSWCQTATARDSHGLACQPDDPGAERWDLHGAVVMAVERDPADPLASAARRGTIRAALQARLRDGQNLMRWQDRASTTHAQVLALIDEAIEEAEKP